MIKKTTLYVLLISAVAILVICGVFAAKLFSNYDKDKNYIAEQFFDYHKILRVSDEALFNRRGKINQNVLNSLMAILNDESLSPLLRPKTWPTGVPYTGQSYYETTAEDFSRFVTGSPDPEYFYSDSGAILIKLFETVPHRRGRLNAFVTDFTKQWWQLVYRATDSDQDVLTLWMYEPYRNTAFNGNRYDHHIYSHDNCPYCKDRANELYACIDNNRNAFYTCIPTRAKNSIISDVDFFAFRKPNIKHSFEGNYSQSIARDNLLRDINAVLRRFKDARNYIITPSQLPGKWQSSEFQTGTNARNEYYISGRFQGESIWDNGSAVPRTGLGATGLIWGHHSHFTLNNGLDGLSVGPYNNGWAFSQQDSAYDDLFWLPSDYEVRSMGHYHDNARFQTFARNGNDPTSRLWTNAYYPWRDEHGIDSDPPECPEYRPDNGKGRSGLWRLNGYDRAFSFNSVGTDRAWLRSTDSIAMGSENTVYFTGNRYSHGVIYSEGLRPGVHLNLTKLAEGYLLPSN